MTMVLALLSTLAMLQTPARPAEPVRVWRSDSTAYVALRQPGHLLVLHVDAIGRIQVLYPLTPDDTFAVANQARVAIGLPPTAEGNPATFLAIRSRWAFDFSAVRWGSWWDYQNALLLQPTAGDPLAALLEIADRVTDGRPYEYGEATYARNGTLVARGPVQAPEVCLSCVRRGPPVVAVAAPAPANSVDCSNASLANSFCGVASAPVTITSVTTAPPPQVIYQPAPPAVYVPYYLPGFAHSTRPRVEPPPPPPPPPATPRSVGVAYPIPPRRIVPSSASLRH